MEKEDILQDESNDGKQLELLPAIRESFIDEMNICEQPIALLSTRDNGRNRISLAPGVELVADEHVGGLPTALGEQALIGLMALTKHQTRFSTPTVEFDLRDLVRNYIYPGRAYNVNARTLRDVEEQITRIAHTRLMTDRWYDKQLGKVLDKSDIAIIADMHILDNGGRNRSRRLRVTWGPAFFKSVQAGYTKFLDAQLYHNLSSPLERRFYRWLDRQMGDVNPEVKAGRKIEQRVPSCQDFARSKLAMTGEKLEQGGRTASGYVVRQLKKALDHYEREGFAVRMVVDMRNADYSLIFDRLDGAKKSEAIQEDHGRDLVLLFLQVEHARPKEGLPPPRLREGDRVTAERWLEAYGKEQAAWMVRRSIELHRKGPKASEKLMSFNGLLFYELAAASDYERKKEAEERAKREAAGQLRLKFMEELWAGYQQAMLRRAESVLDKDAQDALAVRAKELVEKTQSKTFRLPESILDKQVAAKLAGLKLEHVGAMPETEFMAFEAEDALRGALAKRHGKDPLATIQASK